MTAFFPWKRAMQSFTVWFSLLTMLTFGLVAVLAPLIATHDPYQMSIHHSILPPMWVQNVSPAGIAEYPLGTDFYGRDVLSRLIYGTRTALFLALAAVSLTALIGTTIGLISGYIGGRLDTWITHFTNTIYSLPSIMFIVVIVLIFRNMLSPSWFHGLITLVIGFAAVGWVGLSRLIRINVLQLKSQTFVEAAISLGASSWYVIGHHLLPNVMHMIVVWIINTIPAVILLEAVLGYIGVGVTGAIDGGEFTVVSWGGMFFSGRSALSRNPLMLVIPSTCILLISMSFILLGDFLSGITRPE
jgi:peptide/nickel transport system permease protein